VRNSFLASKLSRFSGEKLHPGVLFFPFAILSFFAGHRDPSISMAGNFLQGATSGLAILLALAVLIVEKPIERSTSFFLSIIALLIPIYCLWFFDDNQEFRLIAVRLIQIITVISLVYVSFCIGRSPRGRSGITIFAAVCSILLLGRGVTTMIFRGSGLDAYNTNTVGLWFAGMIMIPFFLSGKMAWKFLVVGTALAGLIVTNSRTALGAIFVGMIVYLFWRLIISRKILFWLPFFLIFGFSFWVVFMLGYSKSSLLVEFNLLFREWTGKNLLSGRDRLWPELLKIIGESPWIGHGGGVSPSTLRVANVSSHNFFLQILLQVGIVGLLPVLISWILIWKNCWKFRHSHDVRVAASIFLIIILCQTFEVTLFQVNFALSIPMWISLGLAFGIASEKEKPQGFLAINVFPK
jgi:O-antigen ligase